MSRCYVATALDAGKRIDALLGSLALYPSRSAASRAIEEGDVLVNGSVTTKKYKVATGDAIIYEPLVEEVDTPLTGEPIPLDIRFDDDCLAVISKQDDLICHPSPDHRDHTLVNALIYHYGAQNLCNVQGDKDRLGIVHRLDMDTSGLMLVAKTDECGALLMDAIRARAVDRRYIALVHGVIPLDTGMIDAPIARSEKERRKMAVRDVASSRDALTTFRVLERFKPTKNNDGYTLIECKLYTGRTHQIRVHMEYTHHPLVGDPFYTASSPRHEEANFGLRRQFLHSYRVSFDHPTTLEPLSFVDYLPDDLQEIYVRLDKRNSEITEAGNEVLSLMKAARSEWQN